MLHSPDFNAGPTTLNNQKSRILAQLQNYRAAKPGPFWAALGIVGVSLFGMVAAFGTAPTVQEIQSFQHTVVEPLAVPQSDVIDTTGDTFVREERIQRGDTVSSLLSRIGVVDSEATNFLRNSRDAQAIFRQLSPGKSVISRVDAQGELQQLIFPLSGSKDLAFSVERQGTGFKAVEQPLQLDTQVLMKSAEIRYSLFGATDAAGIPDAIATQLADIFGGDIDFHHGLRKGDRFSVIYETVNHMGKLVRTGRILAAEFINDGKSYRAIWFQGDGGQGGYYTADGKNIRKAFLRSPLEFSRITSGFSLARFHPILQKWRAHEGIDYGAPVGTHVKATGDGVVEFVGNKGGYGKVVILRHQSRYTTVYGHLSGFAAGLKKGTHVRQGDVIAFVGATGLATGPHLHYEFRIDGVYQNPLTIALPSAPPLAPNQMAQFRSLAHAQLARIDMMRGIDLAALD
ncbi:MAG: peptidoglycan DD-metalloendopeptidase family protein [Rhodocyclaceae bacterium]|nr:peptidoglycan DD-metalloendopeptidase family protein [Rhodocyclaceae bacterium]